MRIALLLGIAVYQKPEDCLPACDSDLEIIRQLLSITGNYEEIFVLSGNNLVSTDVKGKMAEWFENYKDESIEEVFFYYTGHGEFHNDELYFPLFNYEPTKRKQTSLSNSELDSWLRNLKAELTVKVIDACNSGIFYVKGNENAFTKYLDKSVSNFQKCIFMFSSTTQQYSWQDSGSLSFFTQAFVNAVKNHEYGTIRYRDIIDYISDQFENDTNQTPVFVTQAYNTEVFSSISPEIKALTVPQNSSLAMNPDIEKQLTLKDLIEADARHYVSKEQGLNILNDLRNKFNEYYFSDELMELYAIEVGEITARLPNEKAIGQWIIDNPSSYFVEPAYESRWVASESLDRLTSRVMDVASALRDGYYESVLVGFRHTIEVPFRALRIGAERIFLNLQNYACYITFFPSRNKLLIFYIYRAYKDKNWDESITSQSTDWKTYECNFASTEQINLNVEAILDDFEAYILSQLRAKFNRDT